MKIMDYGDVNMKLEQENEEITFKDIVETVGPTIVFLFVSILFIAL